VSKSGQPVQERVVEGYEYVIFAYEVGGGASNGVVHNTIQNATGLSGNQNNSSFGTNVMEFSCSLTQTRELIPVPPKPLTTEKVIREFLETKPTEARIPHPARGSVVLPARSAGVTTKKGLLVRKCRQEGDAVPTCGDYAEVK
jgi:hypothetical protein